jgi:hypothetical protein
MIRLRSPSAGSTRNSTSANSIARPNHRTPTKIESITPTAKLRDKNSPVRIGYIVRGPILAQSQQIPHISDTIKTTYCYCN